MVSGAADPDGGVAGRRPTRKLTSGALHGGDIERALVDHVLGTDDAA
jgi:hypothetical protein